MKVIGGRIRLSATDLANHVACRHLTALDLAVAEDRLALPESTAWLPASMQQRGEAHERAYIEHLRATHAASLISVTAASTVSGDGRSPPQLTRAVVFFLQAILDVVSNQFRDRHPRLVRLRAC